jgi:hypothetical protein
MSERRSWLGLLLVACCTTLGARTAFADAILIGPDFGMYKVGQHLSDDAVVDIGSCGWLITLWNGRKFVYLRGPYKGRLGAYKTPKLECYPEVIRERETVYDRYFRQICVRQNLCDAACKATFQLVTDKASMKLKCQ